MIFSIVLSANVRGENDSSQNGHVLGSDERKQQYKLFLGHAGPVYAASFSPRGDYIISSSSDTTSTFSHFYAQ